MVALCLSRSVGAEQSADRLKNVQQRIRRTEDEAKSLESKAEGALGEMEKLDRSISARERAVAEVAADIRSARARKETAERALARLDAQLPRLRAAFAARARGLYRLTRRGLAPLVFRAPREWSEALRFRPVIVCSEHVPAVLASIRPYCSYTAPGSAPLGCRVAEARPLLLLPLSSFCLLY